MRDSKRTTARPAGRVTGSQVAREARVDPAIVSRLLRNDPTVRVSPETRQRVMDVVERLGYRPNFAAQRLRSQRISAVGLVIPDFRNPAFGEVVHGAEQASHLKGITLFAASPPDGTTNLEVVTDFVASQRVDGLLVAGGDREETAKTNEYLAKSDIPYLFLNRKTTGLERTLFLDDEFAMSLAVNHLVGLGHKRIGLVGGRRGMETGGRRRRAFMQALKQAKLQPNSDWITEADYSYKGGRDGLLRVFEKQSRPTAVVVAEFVSGIGALGAAREFGLQVPDDVSLVVLNDLDAANYTTPTLTTVGLQLSAMGSEAVELLLTRPSDEPINATVSKPAQLHVRSSTSPPAS